MSSIWTSSAHDQENVHVLPHNLKAKQFNALKHKVPSKKRVSHGNAKLAVSSKLHQDKAGVAVTGRTFGDISNKISNRGLISTPAHKSAGLKCTQQQKPSLLQQQKSKPIVKTECSERDFFPVILEVEDYSDIFPPHLELDNTDMKRLVQHWATQQGPPLPSLCCYSPPASPQHWMPLDLSLQINTQYGGLEPITLFPVDESCGELEQMSADW